MSCMAEMIVATGTDLTVFRALVITSGVFWALAYLLIIFRGFRDRTFGMPVIALCANISWEFIFAFVEPHDFPQNTVNAGWFLLDLVIFAQLLRFWRADYPRVPGKFFYPFLLLALVACLGLILAITLEFEDCGAYSAFGQNLLMSILFIALLFQRRSVRGQSVYVALAKLFGTALASLAAWLFATITVGSVLLPYLFVAILVFDGIYLLFLCHFARLEGLNPWRRA